MDAERKFDLDHRLEVYFATLRSSYPKEALKRKAGNWQVYAAAAGSALAMVTGASASIIGAGSRDIAAEPVASVGEAKHLASSTNAPWKNAVRLAMAKQDSGERFFKSAGAKSSRASQAQVPSISPGGVVPLFSTTNIIQPGEFVSIYGNNLAGETAVWNGDFPTSLGGTSVEIDGKPAYLLFVSPGQINLQAPDDTATGTVSVVVTTAAGSGTSTVTLGRFGPSFILLDAKYVAGIILRPNGSGAFGKGKNSYDILGPAGGSPGYPTAAARSGDIVELFGVGFGPTIPAVPAGEPFSGAAPINYTLSLYVNEVLVKPTFAGLSSAGLYQINLTVPRGLGEADVPIQAIVGGMPTQPGVLFPMQVRSNFPVVGGSTVAGSNPGTFFTSVGSAAGGGTGGGNGGGGGTGGGSGGGSAAIGKKPYLPRLNFPPSAADV